VFVKQFRTGGDRNFGYLVADETKKKAAIIDPSYSPEMIVEFARGRDYEIEYVFSTHDHFDHFPLGNLEIQILHTPGHTNDGICIYIEDTVFTGDTLFVGKVGGTDLGPGAKAEYDSLHQKLFALPDNTRVFPGHDYGTAPESTIAHERETNPFFLQPDFEAFVHLKRNWEAYKKAHGIS
jgi:glyoxylase-like metal-dependent hydrolase (beta-lactamase superfamily II)